MASSSRSRLSAVQISGTILVALLLFTSPVIKASERDVEPDGRHWSEWEALGSGFVARRRVPSRIKLPTQQRRLPTTQARGEWKAENDSNLREDTVFLDSDYSTKAGPKVKALWLRTRAAGLYSVSVADVADVMGIKARKILEMIRQGQLSLTNDDQPVKYALDLTSDRILFVAESYDTFYSDENAYRLSVSGRRQPASQLMEVVTGMSGARHGMGMAFPDTLKFEEEPDFYYSTWTVAAEPDADYWFWAYLHGGYQDIVEVPLVIPDPSMEASGRLRVTLRGWTDIESGNEHLVHADLNGVNVGSVTFDAFDEAVLAADFDPSVLVESGNNTLTLRNEYTRGTHPGQWLDQVEIDYLRRPVANNGSLWLRDVDAGTQTVTGFSSHEILVFESPSGTTRMRKDVTIGADGSGWSVSFETNEGEDYFVVERSAFRDPVLEADYRSSLRKKKNRAEYLIIAPRDFSDTATALASYRQRRSSDVKIAWLDDIYGEFSGGLEDPSAIGRFMTYVASQWRLAPSYVTLIGKGSLDEKNRMGYDDSFLPIRMSSTPWALASSDGRLLGFEDDAPFAFGRLPITNDIEGVAYVAKLMKHETTPGGHERFEAVLVADNPDDSGNFHVNSDAMVDRLLYSLEFDRVGTLYHPINAVRDRLIQSDTWEVGYLAYDGHGSATQVGDFRENFITAQDAAALYNGVFPVFVALTCGAGDDTNPGLRSLAGALVLNPRGGAIASMAPTGLSLDTDAQLLGSEFIASLFGNNNTAGDAIRAAKTRASGNIPAFMTHIYSLIGDPAVYAR